MWECTHAYVRCGVVSEKNHIRSCVYRWVCILFVAIDIFCVHMSNVFLCIQFCRWFEIGVRSVQFIWSDPWKLAPEREHQSYCARIYGEARHVPQQTSARLWNENCRRRVAKEGWPNALEFACIRNGKLLWWICVLQWIWCCVECVKVHNA